MRELRERELNDRLKEELMKNAVGAGAPRLPNPLDPHWLEIPRRSETNIFVTMEIYYCNCY